ncbi:unnamed protein product [Linum tenue]|nr:unnamed protein product [Linum tenue]
MRRLSQRVRRRREAA